MDNPFRIGDFVEDVLLSIGKDTPVPIDDVAQALMEWSQALLDYPERINPQQLAQVLKQVAEKIRDREEFVVDLVERQLDGSDGIVWDCVRKLFSETDEMVEMIDDFVANHMADQLIYLEEVPILTEEGYCENCGTKWQDAGEANRELTQMTLEYHEVLKHNRQLELELAERDLIARGALDERAEKLKRGG